MFEEATYVVYPGQSIFQLPEVERPKKLMSSLLNGHGAWAPTCHNGDFLQLM